ncbi:hypothetical protein SOVF_013800, partial [Spinacia oleracea]
LSLRLARRRWFSPVAVATGSRPSPVELQQGSIPSPPHRWSPARKTTFPARNTTVKSILARKTPVVPSKLPLNTSSMDTVIGVSKVRDFPAAPLLAEMFRILKPRWKNSDSFD